MNNKILKKIVGMFGYKIIEKNFIKNQNILFEKSDLTIEKILSHLFERKYIKCIVQIGANDGISYEHINYFIKKYKIKSLLVEPIKNNFKLLVRNYKNLNYVNLENCAISSNNEINYLYKVDEKYLKKYDASARAIPSFNYKHLIKHGIKKKHIVKEIINQISFLDLFKKYKINSFDLLYIDTEGYDCLIINEFFLKINKIRPIIIFEWSHIKNNELQSTLNKMLNNNYSFFPVGDDVFCFPIEKNIFINLN